MITFKDNVRIIVYSHAVQYILRCLQWMSDHPIPNQPSELVVTSINDSVHKPDSKHYKNMAIDVRSHNFPDRSTQTDFMTALLQTLNVSDPQYTNSWTILFEDEGTDNEHFHIQVRMGMLIP